MPGAERRRLARHVPCRRLDERVGRRSASTVATASAPRRLGPTRASAYAEDRDDQGVTRPAGLAQCRNGGRVMCVRRVEGGDQDPGVKDGQPHSSRSSSSSPGS